MTGADGTVSDTASLTVVAGPVASLTVSPTSSTITAGGSQTYRVSGFDRFGNARGRVGASLSVDGGGSCTATSCTSTVAGLHTVTAEVGGTAVTATLRVTPAAATTLTVTPRSSTIAAGGAQAYLVSAFDRYGNTRGRIAAILSITGAGSCSATTCTATGRRSTPCPRRPARCRSPRRSACSARRDGRPLPAGEPS